MTASTSLSLVRLGVLYRRLLMLRFYADTSGKSGDTAFVAAGYLAHVKRWRTFERAWGDILRDAGVQEFHATDFYSGYGEFAGDEWRHEVNGRMVPGHAQDVWRNSVSDVAFALQRPDSAW